MRIEYLTEYNELNITLTNVVGMYFPYLMK